MAFALAVAPSDGQQFQYGPSPTCGFRVRGDFNGNCAPDLAIGVPYQTVGSATSAGEVHIMYSSVGSGLGSAGNLVLRQGSSGMQGSPGMNDRFGAALAIGFFDGDDYADLAIGVPGEMVSGKSGAGAVMIVYGGVGGLNPARNQYFNEDAGSMDLSAATNDGFGSALAVGDFDADGYDDLLIGVPGKDVSGHSNAGVVHVLYGGPGGLSASRSGRLGLFYQDPVYISGDVDDDDKFGAALATGDFNGDGYSDAAIGVPGDLANGAGAVNIIYGGVSGLTSAGNKRFYRGSGGMEDSANSGDMFGAALAVGDFNGDNVDDLAIGAYGDDILPVSGSNDGGGLDSFAHRSAAGSVSLLYGVAGVGLSTVDAHGNPSDQFWSQNSAGIDGCAVQAYDWFGYALIAGDFDGDGVDDLVVGVPGESIGSIAGAGMINVIYGGSGGLSYHGNQFWHQDSSSIAGAAQVDDNFGWALAAADFDRDGKCDLVVGVPHESVSGVTAAGAVNLLYGKPDCYDGLAANDNQCWHRADSGMGTPQVGAKFGYSLAARK